MWNGKLKAVTFSYDDGVTQDIRFIEMLDRYGLKGTFNINSELLGLEGHLIRQEKRVNHTKIPPEKVKEVYKNHEVAAHTLTHPTLITVEDDNEVIRQVEQDRLNLEKLTGYEILGMAYPGGGVIIYPPYSSLFFFEYITSHLPKTSSLFLQANQSQA